MTKVTLSIDDEVLARVRERAVKTRGKMRSLSEEIEELLEDSFATEQAEIGLRKLCCGRTDHVTTYDEIAPVDFASTPSAGEMIREMRRNRG